MARFKILFIVLVLPLFLLSCGESFDFDGQDSAKGFQPEKFLPIDSGLVISYSLKDDDQYDALRAIEEKLGQNETLSQMVAESLNASMQTLGIDYKTDLMPAFGERYRLVSVVRENGFLSENTDASVAPTPETFNVVTLESPKQLEAVFDKLVAAGTVVLEPLSGMDVYKEATGQWYATIYEDLLLMASDPTNLVAMSKQDEENSLWGSELYQDAISQGAGEDVFYGMIFPEFYNQSVSSLVEFGSGSGATASILDYQALYVEAKDDGFEFDITVKANKEKAKAVDFAFDSTPRFKSYLLSEVPAEKLLGYFESYGIKQSIEEMEKVSGDSSPFAELTDYVRTYFGMDFAEDILAFLDRGYAISLSQKGDGLIPGISLYADISSDPAKAKTFVDKLDGQLSSLLLMLDSALPGLASKDTIMINGADFSHIKIDLSAIPSTEGSPLPAVVTGAPIGIAYGIMDNRLLITTADSWQHDVEKISDSDLYKTLNDKIEAKDGLILLDFDRIQEFAATLRALREQLGLNVSDGALKIEDFLTGFEGLIARSSSKAYEMHSSGYLLLKD